MGIVKRHWGLIAAIGVLYAAVAVLWFSSTIQNDGHLIYASDDTYIHMATAKNFALHGVWGLTQYDFSSSVSSLLWPSLLSLVYVLFGINELSPFIINAILATFLVWLTYALMRRQGVTPLLTFITCIAMIFFTPLPTMIFIGMEHILHALTTISFVYLSARILTQEKATRLLFSLWLIAGILLTVSRYEGLFLILVVLVLLLVKKRYLYASSLAIISVAPLLIYGIISLMNGWYLLPNPVLIKGVSPALSLSGIADFFADAASILSKNPYMYTAIPAAVAFLLLQSNQQKTLWKESSIILVLFLTATILHILFSRSSWFFRQEAYIAALAIFALAIAAIEQWPRGQPISLSRSLMLKYTAIALLTATTVLLITSRAIPSLVNTPQATTNIYQQQYQMGLFLREFYQGEAVAANDIGAINYLAEIRCLDLMGMGSLEVAKAKMFRYYTTDEIYQLGRDKKVKVAIVYRHWFKWPKRIPAQWIRVERWRIPNNVVCGGDTVSFYAVDPEAESELIENLRSFSPRLPAEVKEIGK